MCRKAAEKAQIQFIEGVIQRLMRRLYALTQNDGTLGTAFAKTAHRKHLLSDVFAKVQTAKQDLNSFHFERIRIQKQLWHYEHLLSSLRDSYASAEFTLAA